MGLFEFLLFRKRSGVTTNDRRRIEKREQPREKKKIKDRALGKKDFEIPR